ncbi:MAG: S49 family peptidase [Saprospiraceae bacterium]|nr:S49 family peptidase [Saprospiraceae bacterium]
MSLENYNKSVKIKDSKSDNKIAVVYLEGEIAYGEDNKGVITKNKYGKVFTKILEDKEVKAVVLGVNSPGGDAFTSEVIWDYIEKVKAKGIPVVASMGDYALPGGYYISCGADYIYSQPNTLTGSIGVFAMFPNFSSLTRDKLGVNFDTVKTNDLCRCLKSISPIVGKRKNYNAGICNGNI